MSANRHRIPRVYRWVCALKRAAHNARQVVEPLLEILSVLEMLVVRVIIFALFLYGAYALASRAMRASGGAAQTCVADPEAPGRH